MLVKNSYMLTMNDSDIRKSTNILCTWLRQLSGFKNLPYCIIHLMDGLRVTCVHSATIAFSVHADRAHIPATSFHVDEFASFRNWRNSAY